MAWPTSPTGIKDVPLLEYESPWFDEAVHLLPDGVQALCTVVTSQHGLLEAITRGNEEYERTMGSALGVAVMRGGMLGEIDAVEEALGKVISGFGRQLDDVMRGGGDSVLTVPYVLRIAVLSGMIAPIALGGEVRT